MLKIFCVLLFTALAVKEAATEILRLKCETYANFSVIQENKRLMNHTYLTLTNTDLPMCQYECVKDAKCKSINIKNDEDICELNSKSADDAKDRVATIPEFGWTFFSPFYKERLVTFSQLLIFFRV